MPARNTHFIEGQFYHVYNRGRDKQNIFFEDENYRYFIRLLEKNCARYHINVLAFCLMPNHYHILIKIMDEGNLSKFIGATLNSYVQAINKRYNRSGPLFENRFNSVQVEDESYLVHLCRYIHINPLKVNLVKTVREWPFSNYQEFVGERQEVMFDSEFLQDHFSSHMQYREFINDSVTQPGLRKYLFE